MNNWQAWFLCRVASRRGGLAVSCGLAFFTLLVGQNSARAQALSQPVPDGQLQGQPVLTPAATPGPAVAIQGGLSGLTRTIEAEVAFPSGLVVGAGIHGGRYAPVGPTGRLAYDHAFNRTFHLRLGLRTYPFSEGACSACVFVVPEIGLRIVASSGFVFEFGQPIARLNLNRLMGSGSEGALKSDGHNSFLVSLLVGFSRQF